MNRIINIILLCGFLMIDNHAIAQNNNYSDKAKLLFKGFMDADYEAIKPLLDDSVKIGSLPTGMNDAIMPQLLAQLPKPQSCKITSITREGNDTRVKAEFMINGSGEERFFLFGNDGRVKEMDILGKAQAETMQMPVNNGEKIQPAVIKIPFKTRHGLIFVRAELNGKTGNFLLDTGAPLLMINSRHMPEGSGKKIEADAQGIGGKINNIEMMHLDSFKWNGMQIRNAEILANNMRHIEKKVRMKFLGLIGYDVFKDYAITFDYDNEVIKMVRSDTTVNDDDYGTISPVYKGSAPLTMVGHIPVIKIKITGKEYSMGLDCGAEGNILYEKYIPAMGSNFSSKRKQKMGGAGEDIVKVPSGIIQNAFVGKIKFEDLRTVFSDESLNTINNGFGSHLDGLVGYPFLKQYITTIDYGKNEVRFYEEQ